LIKEFSKNDFQKCCDLFIYTFNRPPWHDEWTNETAHIYLKELVDSKRFVGYTLWDNDSLIGVAFCHTRFNWRGDELAVDLMFISPDHQRKGCGLTLMNAVETFAKDNSCITITLSTGVDAPAFSFYEKLGFEKVPEKFWVSMHKPVEQSAANL